MGMALSQARLLALTSRQHDVEMRAQVLQACKLQLANDSDHVYNNYINALNDTKNYSMYYLMRCLTDSSMSADDRRDSFYNYVCGPDNYPEYSK